MKKLSLVRAAALALALILACGIFASCSNNGNGATTTAPVANSDATTPAGEETQPEDTTPTALSVLGEKDLEKATVTFYSRYYNGIWRSDLMATEDDTDTLMMAVYRRNKFLEETYNFTLDEIQSGTASFKPALEKLVSTGDQSFDVVYRSVTDAAESAQAGLFWDLHDISQIDLESRWWSQSCNKSWSIGHRQFFAIGDISTVDNMSARGVFFNKKIAEANQLESPYDCVKNNTWTLDKMFEMATAATVPSLDGTGSSVYGISAQNSFGFIMLMATGEFISRTNEDDIPEINIGNERSLAVVDKLMTKTAGNEGIFLGSDNDVMTHFRNAEALFMPEVLYHLITLRDSDLDVGIVPSPKYDAEQDSYYSFTTCYGVTCLGFPQSNTGDRLERAAFVVEAMSVQSLTTVTPAYFDVCIKTRFAPDIEASGTIQLILDGLYTDLAEAYKWGGLRDKVQNAVKEGQNLTTSIATSKKIAETAIKLTVANWQKVPKLGA